MCIPCKNGHQTSLTTSCISGHSELILVVWSFDHYQMSQLYFFLLFSVLDDKHYFVTLIGHHHYAKHFSKSQGCSFLFMFMIGVCARLNVSVFTVLVVVFGGQKML